jgi:hypothetical protein
LLDVEPDAAAIVLASDGIHNRGESPIATAERLGIPVYTVALGDTTVRRDAVLSQVRHNRIAYQGGSFPVEVTLNATLLKGNSSQLTITDSRGRTVASQRVTYEDDDFSLTVTFDLQASEAGMQRYNVTLTPVDGEVERGNNHQTFYVDIIDSRRKVAIVGNAPHPDLAALKHAVESNPNFEAEVIVENGERGTESGERSLVILHNLPSSAHAIPRWAEALPQIFIIGAQTDLPRFNALHSGLEIVTKTKKTNEVTAVYNDRFSLFHYDAGDGAALEQLPPLTSPFGEVRTSSSLQSLLTARLGTIDTRQPLVAATAQGAVRRAFVWGEGLWKWRLNDYLNNSSHEHFDRLVSQLVTFTAMSDQRELFSVDADRHYTVGDNIVLRAQLYNDAYEPFNTPDAKLSLKGDSLDADYEFARQGNGYTLSLGSLPEGLYRYRATTTSADGKSLAAEGSFAVEALHLELANLTADHTLLRTLSSITGGQMYYPDQLSELSDQLSSLKPVIYTHTRFSELLSLPWILGLIILLLGAEWVMRKVLI